MTIVPFTATALTLWGHISEHVGMDLLKMGKTAKVSLYISEIRPSDNMARSKYSEICSTSDLTRNVKSCQRN